MGDIIARGLASRAFKKAGDLNISKMLQGLWSYNPSIQGDANITGRPVVSDPSSFIALIPNENVSSTIKKTFLAYLCSKSVSGGNTKALGANGCDLGWYPKKLNYHDTTSANVASKVNWRIRNGYPLGILEFVAKSYDTGTSKLSSIQGVAFTWQDVLYIVCNTQDTDMIQLAVNWVASDWGGSADINNSNAAYTTVNNQGVINIADVTSGQYASMACTGMDKYLMQISYIDVTLPITSSTAGVTNGNVYAAMGRSGMALTGPGQTVFCVGIGTNQSYIQTQVVNGVTNWETALANAEAYWLGVFAKIPEINAAPEIRNAGLLVLQQLEASRYGGYMTAGLPHWQNAYIRDTGFIMYGLAPWLPDTAKEILNWFSSCTTFTNQNQFDVNHVAGVSYANTDNVAFFLIGAGSVWAHTHDLVTFTALKPRLDEAIAYVKTNYSTVDKHVLCIHPHDDLDDYQATGMITVASVKYESLIDVLWTYAIQQIMPVYQVLGDTVNYNQLASILAGLQSSLGDFRRADGGLEYAIKTDSTKYNTVLQSRSNLYAALWLDDSQCLNWLKDPNNANILAPFSSSVNWAVIPYNWSTGHLPLKQIWHEHLLLTGILAARVGDYQYLINIFSNFPFGGLPDYVGNATATVADNNDWYLKYYQLSWSQTWAAAAMLELVRQLELLR